MLTKEKNIKVEELLGVFNDIESIIRELHKSSSDVFMQLNSFLKDYSKKNSIVTTNATQIFDSIAGNRENGLSSELYNIFDEYVGFKSGTEIELDENLLIETKLNTKADNILLLVRNLKQDLLTLKYLFSNYKMINRNGNLSVFTINDVNRWERSITNIIVWLSAIDKYVSSLRINLENFNIAVKSHSHKCFVKNAAFSEELKSSISLIKKKDLESKKYIPEIKEKLKSTTDSIANIITHLQYHDIIRQKIEHIQESHEKISEKLKKKLDERTGNRYLDEDDEIISLITDISGLQSAQLIFISKEYQNALDVISDNFQKIAGDITTVSTVSHEFLLEESGSDTTLINVVKERMNRFLLVVDEYNSNIFNVDLLRIWNCVENISTEARADIIEPLKKLHQALKIDSQFKEQNSDKPNIISQICLLTNDIFYKNFELEKELSELEGVAETFQSKFRNSGFRTNMEEEQIKVMVKISKVLDQLDSEGNILDSVILENGNIKKEVANRLKSILDQADYNEMFEKLLDKIIGQLNLINNRFKKGGELPNNRLKFENLRDVEELYTVASERIIHGQIVNNSFNENIPDTSGQDDDLELF